MSTDFCLAQLVAAGQTFRVECSPCTRKDDSSSFGANVASRRSARMSWAVSAACVLTVSTAPEDSGQMPTVRLNSIENDDHCKGRQRRHDSLVLRRLCIGAVARKTGTNQERGARRM